MLAVEAAIRAGSRIMEVYETSFSVEMKEDRTPLTMADRESHRIISEMLSVTGLPILSEEGRAIPYQERRSWERFWLIDPLDGTKEFVRRNGEFTVNIALVEDQQTVLGVIYAPYLEQLYYASRELGSWYSPGQTASAGSLEELKGMSRQLRTGQRKGNYTVVASRSHFSPETEEFVQDLQREHPGLEFISAGSSLKLCLVADGSADIYPRLGPTMEWDTAAGQAIVECAGGKVLEFESGQPLMYNKRNLLNPWFVVS